ncbi:MAG: superoxide dismutase [Rikenellaceae bacterium]
MSSKLSCPKLSYSFDALEPIISRETVELHYGKHLQAYLDNFNKFFAESDYKEYSTLEDVVRTSKGALYNNAAQVWNHLFYFNTFTPKQQRDTPEGSLLHAIELFYGSFDEFKAEFERQGVSLFGSGWVWLTKSSGDELRITQESNAGNPMCEGWTPLLTFDVWEHAYYVDYRNRRAEHLSKLWGLVDWNVVEARYMDEL